jgi:outer membrane lipoprotein SlyB
LRRSLRLVPLIVKSPQSYFIVVLALTTLGGAGIAWNQHRELIELRAAAMIPDERAEWQKRAWDLESRNRQLQDELAALQARADGDGAGVAAGPEAGPAEPGRGRGGLRGGRGPNNPQQQLNAMRELANKPEVQALVRVQQKAAIDARYAALFRNLNLPPDQLDRLKNLLAERQTTNQDVLAAAREQGLNPRSDPEGFRKLIADAQNEINNGIKSIVGDSGFTQLQTYEQTLPQRNVVNELQQRLSYSDTPLTAAQADQLVQILASNTPQRAAGNNSGQPPPGPGGFGRPGAELGGMLAGALGGGAFNAIAEAGGRVATAPVTAGAISQAQTILAPQQAAALKEIQQQQQSQQQLQQILREAMTPNPAAGTDGGTNQVRRRGGG